MIGIPAVLTGAATALVQVLMLREFLKVMGGNELVTGLILGLWMLWTGMGAFLAGHISRKRPATQSLSVLFSMLALLPLLMVTANTFLRDFLSEPGVSLSFSTISWWSAVTLLPFCMMSGAVFSLLVAKGHEHEKPNSGGRIYGLESAGSLAGGLISGMLIAGILNNLHLMMLASALMAAAAILVIAVSGRKPLLILPLLIFAFTLFAGLRYDSSFSLQKKLYPEQNILEAKDSPLGHLVLTEKSSQLNYYCNGNLLFTSDQKESDEASVHFALLQRQRPAKVLFIGGHSKGISEECAKYRGLAVDFCEPDPVLLNLQQQYESVPEKGSVRFESRDFRILLQDKTACYDAIVVSNADPGSLLFNRYYTTENLKLFKQVLQDSGVLSLSLPSSAEYMGPKHRALFSSIFMSIRSVFPHVLLVPGNRDFLLASEQELRADYAELSSERGLRNNFVNADYLDDFSMEFRRQQILEKLDTNAPLNTTDRPVSSFFALRSWLEMTGGAFTAILIFAGIILILPLFTGGKRAAVLWTIGFTGTAAEIILLLAYQTCYGHLYSISGLFFAVFMAGLALGALLHNGSRIRSGSFTAAGQLLLAGLCLIIPWVVAMATSAPPWSIHLIFFSANFLVAFLSGRQFALIVKQQKKTETVFAGRAYAYDLAGAAAGAIFVSALLLPLIGIFWLCVALGVMNIIAAILARIQKT